MRRIASYFWSVGIVFFVCFACNVHTEGNEVLPVDVIIFSFDRPLQLYALLESMDQHMRGVGTCCVLYRSSNESFDKAYQEVAKRFYSVLFVKQGSEPRNDFKLLTMHLLKSVSSPYVMFAVDDIIVKDDVDLSYCARMLECTSAYGFYLRLGCNIDYCYSENRATPVPPMQEIDDACYAWSFYQGKGDWGYPNTVDMTVYRRDMIYAILSALPFSSPNQLEGHWASGARGVMHLIGLCFEQSKIVNIPLNLVQQDWHNRHMDSYTPQELLDIFSAGKKMDISTLEHIVNKSPHMEHMLTFIDRS